MRFYESKAIACALSLAMATSMALPIGAFAAVDDSGQTQHEQKADGIDNGVDVNADRTENADKDASQDIDSGFVGDANEGRQPEGPSEEGGEPGEQQPGENLGVN